MSETSTNIALIGMPGSGKSTVGRHLAKRLEMTYTDCDHVLEERIGCTIREFFEREGEVQFRELEADILSELLTKSGLILATGGGVILREDNRLVLGRKSKVIYLRSTPEDLLRRVGRDNKRPLLQVQNPLDKLRELFSIRDPLYREIADISIDTGRPSVHHLVNKIIMQLEMEKIFAASTN